MHQETSTNLFFRSRRFSDREKAYTQDVGHILNRSVHDVGLEMITSFCAFVLPFIQHTLENTTDFLPLQTKTTHMNCPRCNSEAHWKDGLIRGRQRYRCKDCNYRYSVEFKLDVNSAETRRLALEMYREGLDFRAISRVLKISYGTVFQWVKKWSKEMDLSKRKGETEVVELSELRAHVCQIKTTDRYGLLLIDMEEGRSLMSVGTGKQSQG